METLNKIWEIVGPLFSGTAVASIVVAILCGILKGNFAKAVEKIDVKQISQETIDSSIGKIKEVAFEHSIQPLVESELKKITEQANAYIKTEVESVNNNYQHIVAILEKLSAYFDNSIGVSEEAKAELRRAIELAKTAPRSVESKVVEEVIDKPQKVAHTSPRIENKVER